MLNNCINIAFPPKRTDPVEYYRKVFILAKNQKVNICRIWLSDFSFNYYKYRNKEYIFRIDEFESIIKLAASLDIKIILTLFDFNEFSSTNINWDDKEHTFETSLGCNFFNKPIDFFYVENIEYGLSKFHKMLEIFDKYKNLYAWELFNEIDHVKGFNFSIIYKWLNLYIDNIKQNSDKPIYISFSNPQLLKKYSKKLKNINIGLHVYEWPYKEFYKNVIFWQNKYKDNWIMEFGSEKMEKDGILISMISSLILNINNTVAVPWFWERFLQLNIYNDFLIIFDFLSKYINKEDRFIFVGRLGSVKQRIDNKKVINSFKLSIESSFIKIFFHLLFFLKSLLKFNKNHILLFENKKYFIYIKNIKEEYMNSFINGNSIELVEEGVMDQLSISVYLKLYKKI
ncbi:MAG: hypothetical protein PHH83_00900 [Patescibacteria group bacterium]|nr:hypothetical protein [Patescibacteria group bacterium]